MQTIYMPTYDRTPYKEGKEAIVPVNRLILAEESQNAYSKENMTKRYIEEYDRDGKKERVLLIDVNCKYSSTGKIVYDLYQSIRDDGREAAICYGRGQKIKEENIYKFGLDWETTIHAGLARVTGYNGYFSPLSTHRLIKFIEEYNPDIIHIHELHAYFVNIRELITYIKKKEIPVVWTFHCEYMYTGKCGHAYECTRYREECGGCPAIHEYPKSIFADKTREMLKMKKELLEKWNFTIVTPSQWLADRVRTSFLKEKNIRVIWNGIDTDIFHPVDTLSLRKKLKIDINTKTVLFVAPDVMSDRKGGKWVIELSKKLKNENITFLMVGGGDIPEKIPKNVLFAGEIKEQNEMAKYYSLADVFLICSERETYSMTCAEALCCGTPVVGFKSGAPESVFKGDQVAFVDYGDIQALEEELRNRLYS